MLTSISFLPLRKVIKISRSSLGGRSLFSVSAVSAIASVLIVLICVLMYTFTLNKINYEAEKQAIVMADQVTVKILEGYLNKMYDKNRNKAEYESEKIAITTADQIITELHETRLKKTYKYQIKGFHLTIKDIFYLSIILIMAYLIVMRSMMSFVTQRYNDICLLKYVGAQNFHIAQMLIFEAGLQGFWGTVIGMLIGTVISIVLMLSSFGGSFAAHFTIDIVANLIGFMVVFGVLLSILAVFYPVITVFRIGEDKSFTRERRHV